MFQKSIKLVFLKSGFFPNIKVEQLDKIFLAYVSIFSSRVVDNMPINNDKNALAKKEIGPPTYILFGKKDQGSSINFQKIVCHHMKESG